jgi:hypothetical protein
VEVQLHPVFDLGTRRRCVVSFTPRKLTSVYHLHIDFKKYAGYRRPFDSIRREEICKFEIGFGKPTKLGG